jgi:hypothetical protein
MLSVAIDGEIAILAPVPLLWLPNLEILLGQLATVWRSHHYALGDLWVSGNAVMALAQMQRIIDLHPRVDLPRQFGFDVSILDDDEIERLFFRGAIRQLNQAKPLDWGKADEHPPWSSGEFVTDLLTDLTFALGGSYQEAIALCQTQNIHSAQNILRRLNDLWKGRQARQEERLKKYFHEEWESDPDNADWLAEQLL